MKISIMPLMDHFHWYTELGHPCMADPAGIGGIRRQNYFFNFNREFWMLPLWWRRRLMIRWNRDLERIVQSLSGGSDG
jgi:hypothetical protein